MTDLKLKFDPNQDYQLEAIRSITGLFDGLPAAYSAETVLDAEIVANLSRANLDQADLRGAGLRDTDLRGLDLTTVIYDETTKWPWPDEPMAGLQFQAAVGGGGVEVESAGPGVY